ncbi:MAG: hypothetical protein OHK006_23930 [Thermodesulfovibrionales bacterium]
MGILKGIAGLFKTEEEIIPRNLGRNDECWCGSSKKYKKCHLEEDERRLRAQQTITCGKT